MKGLLGQDEIGQSFAGKGDVEKTGLAHDVKGLESFDQMLAKGLVFLGDGRQFLVF